MSLPILGWKERASLPEWGIHDLRVKFDTGARTSAIHVSGMRIVGHHDRDGESLPVLRLLIPLSRSDPERCATVTTHAVGYKRVRDTGARSELRPIVRTRLSCGPLEHDVDVTVTDRAGMIFRMIIGRQALAGKALVDPARGYLTGRRRTRSRRPAEEPR